VLHGKLGVRAVVIGLHLVGCRPLHLAAATQRRRMHVNVGFIGRDRPPSGRLQTAPSRSCGWTWGRQGCPTAAKQTRGMATQQHDKSWSLPEALGTEPGVAAKCPPVAPLLRLHHRAVDLGLHQPHVSQGLGEKVLLGGGRRPLLVRLLPQKQGNKGASRARVREKQAGTECLQSTAGCSDRGACLASAAAAARATGQQSPAAGQKP